jgi:Flp pilus assembly protein TadB
MFGVAGAGIAVFLFLSVGAVALFSFVAVASWAEARRKEREAYYRSETLKKITESQGAGAVIELIREEEKQTAIRRREGQKLGGLVNIAVGVGLLIFLRALIHDEPAYLVGLIPLLIGVVLLVYALFMAPRE